MKKAESSLHFDAPFHHSLFYPQILQRVPYHEISRQNFLCALITYLARPTCSFKVIILDFMSLLIQNSSHQRLILPSQIPLALAFKYFPQQPLGNWSTWHLRLSQRFWRRVGSYGMLRHVTITDVSVDRVSFTFRIEPFSKDSLWTASRYTPEHLNLHRHSHDKLKPRTMTLTSEGKSR
jgi:hypothetical protein